MDLPDAIDPPGRSRMNTRLKVVIFVCALEVLCLCRTGLAQHGAQPPEPQTAESPVKTAGQAADAGSAELHAALKSLVDQVAALGAEIKKLRHSNEKTSLSLELLLSEE